MSEQNLFFNILTFDFPSENQTFYFSKEDTARSHKIHKSIFPKDIDSLFPGISDNCTDFIYTTFSGEQEGFTPLTIDFTTDNQDFIIKYSEMVAQIAPHFDGDDIPAYGKENLWFL